MKTGSSQVSTADSIRNMINSNGGAGNVIQMIFITMLIDWTISRGRAGTDDLAAQWKSALAIGGLDRGVSVYTVDPGRLLVVCDGMADAEEVNKRATF
jgi:hypothetical protein